MIQQLEITLQPKSRGLQEVRLCYYSFYFRGLFIYYQKNDKSEFILN